MSKKLILSITISLVLGLIGAVLFYKLKPVNCLVEQNTFRKEIMLPQSRHQSETSIEDAISRKRSIREYKDELLNLKEISQLLWIAQGITDPKTGKRAVPLVDVLYPLKVYIMSQIEGLATGIYLYNPYNPSLIKIGDKDLKKRIS